jgi:hypothetical protein
VRPYTRAVTASLAALAACGPPTTPEDHPLLTGVYTAFWSSDFTSVPGGEQTTGGPCPVTLIVRSQRAGAFAGESERGFPCVRGLQQLTGTVDRDGRVAVDLAAAGAFQGFDRCRYVAGDERWRGAVRDRELELTIDVLLACELSGQQQTRSMITARRVPD